PEGQKADLLQVSYTLLHGRQHFRHRYVVVVKDKTDALYLMKRFNVGESLPNSYRNIVSEEFIGQKVMELFGRDLIQRLEKVETSDQYQEIMQGLSNLYCQGYDIPWEQMWKEEPGRIHLPSYPFARDSYWVPTEVVEAKQNYIEDYSDSKNIDTLSTNVDDNKINETTSLPVENVSIDDVEQDSLEVQSREKEDLEELEEELADSLAEALYIDREMILPGKKFIELGLDSIVGVEWIKSLNKTYGIDVKATKVYDYPTIRDFAQYVSSELNHRKKRPSNRIPCYLTKKGGIRKGV
ncbi:phosphopantetheine-binding protein, partial [Gracilibacillus sp. JCM 18860]|uniref:acyl carrier protein n=1 Tax=Gracilibacillus sp. JCM 18860 TaxID=1306159 RepID=UPI000AB01AD9